MRITPKAINDELAARGATERLARARGCFYFEFGEAAGWLDRTVRADCECSHLGAMVGGVPAAPVTESGDNAWRNAGEGCVSQQRPLEKRSRSEIEVTAASMSAEVDEQHHFDVKTAIVTGDATALRRILAEAPVRPMS